MLEPAKRSAENPSDRDWFWSIIEEARKAPDEEGVNERIQQRLMDGDVQDSVEFHALLKSAVMTFDTEDSVAACYLVSGFVSDDAFNEFLNWLVTRGRVVFEKLATNIDFLADLPEVKEAAARQEETEVDTELFNSELDLIPADVIEAKTSEEPPDFFFDHPLPEAVPDWDTYKWFERLPRLSAMFPTAIDGLEAKPE